MLLLFTCFHISFSKGIGPKTGVKHVSPPAPKAGMHSCLTAILGDMAALSIRKQMQAHLKEESAQQADGPRIPSLWQAHPLLSFSTGETSGHEDSRSPSWGRHKWICPLVTLILKSAGVGTHWELSTCLYPHG